MKSVEELIKLAQSTDLSVYQNVSDYFELCRLYDKDVRYEYTMRIYELCMQETHSKATDKPKEALKFYELAKRCALFLSKKYLHYYLIYVEWNREPSKKFYIPRMKTLRVVVDDLQDLADDKLDFLAVSLPPRVGKLVSDDTRVLTKNGWKNHGDLCTKDYVLSPNGDFVRVNHVFPKGFADTRVKFTDGTFVDVHKNHEWVVYNRHKMKTEKLETKEMMSDYEIRTPNKRGHRYFYQMPIKSFVKGEQKKLPVEPYTLGAWLGDGRNNNPDVCGAKEDYPIIERIISDGYPISWNATHKTTKVEYFGFKTLRIGLQSLGMCHSRKRVEKNISAEYLTASFDQRMELLAGLLDTDGTLIKKEKRYQFTTSEKKLRDGFISLVSTFGWRCGVQECEPHTSSSGIKGKLKYWTVSFNPTHYIPCQLKRKQLFNYSKQRKIAISGFESINPKQGNCISVEGGVYCVGERLIPTHNSTLGIFFVTWLMGKYPDLANVMSGHSDKLTKGFYKEVNSILSDTTEYLWNDVFADCNVANRSAEDESIDINKSKRFSTLTCRSISGTLTGAVEAGKLLYVDDIIEDLEEALNLQRLDNKYNAYLNQLKDRKKDNAKELHIGTRWSTTDVIGRIKEQYEDNPRYRFRIIPALNENDESNFDYPYGVGFSTKYYLDMKGSIDNATWCAKYMGEPYVREGLLFPQDELKWYNGVLPDGEPDRKLFVCDVAWGGGDDLVVPFAYVYGNSVYIVDMVCNNGDKTVTQPLVAGRIIQHMPHMGKFEANNGGDEYCDSVDKILRDKNVHINMTYGKASNQKSKMSKIIQYAPDIKNFYFVDDKHASKEYNKAMKKLMTFIQNGINKHDDVPDALAQLVEYIVNNNMAITEIFKRAF